MSADDDGEVFEAAEHGGLATGGWGRREAEVGEPFEQAGDAPDVEARQLRGEAGVRQQPDARYGLAHMVGIGAVCVMHILERQTS